MSVEIASDMIGLEQASAELDRMIAADAQSPKPEAGQPTDQSANAGADRAAQPATESTPTPETLSKTDTPATATEQKTPAEQPKDDKAKADKPEPSRYEKARLRQEKSWQELNLQKAEFKSQQESLAKERAQLEQERQAMAKAKPSFSPEQYEEAAKRFEEQGKFDLADAAREKAAELRKNPPAAVAARDQAQQQAKAQALEATRKEWWSKAAIDFPAVAKDGTPEAGALKAFVKAEPEILESPKALYYAAQMVTAQSTAARVPELEKELGALRAKVKEYERLTAPSGPGSPAKLGEPGNASDSQQLAELERMANEMGAIR